jgi:hypothetical protein
MAVASFEEYAGIETDRAAALGRLAALRPRHPPASRPAAMTTGTPP